MSDTVISVEHLGKRYGIAHQAERQRYTALRDVLAGKAKHLLAVKDMQQSAVRELAAILKAWRPIRWQGGSLPFELLIETPANHATAGNRIARRRNLMTTCLIERTAETS